MLGTLEDCIFYCDKTLRTFQSGNKLRLQALLSIAMDWTKTLPFRELTTDQQQEIAMEFNKMTHCIQSLYGGNVIYFVRDYYILDPDE